MRAMEDGFRLSRRKSVTSHLSRNATYQTVPFPGRLKYTIASHNRRRMTKRVAVCRAGGLMATIDDNSRAV